MVGELGGEDFASSHKVRVLSRSFSIELARVRPAFFAARREKQTCFRVLPAPTQTTSVRHPGEPSALKGLHKVRPLVLGWPHDRL
jgi:hypothetical protein